MNSHQLSKIVFRHFVEICAGGAGILSLISWIGWHAQCLKVSAFSSEYVPMAPSTAWAMILLCCCLYVFNKHLTNSTARYYCYAAVLGVGTISLLIGSQFIFGFEMPLERWITPAAPQMGNHAIGRMSPLTAASFLCAALAILLEMPPLDRRWFTRQIASFSSLLVFLIGISVILSYVWGTPLLYRSQTIPMAMPTAIAFVFLGMGIFYTAWHKNISLSCLKTSSMENSQPIFRWVFCVILPTFLLFSIVIGTVGYRYYAEQTEVFLRTTQDSLAAVAEMKVQQIIDWRNERLSDAQMIKQEPYLLQTARNYFANSNRDDTRRLLSVWLDSIRKHNQSLRALLLDSQMKVHMASPAGEDYLGSVAEKYIKDALLSNQIAISDLHRSRFSDEVHFDMAIPLDSTDMNSNSGGAAEKKSSREPLGVVLLEIDPSKYLYPLLQAWPTPSLTAETLLIRREGDDIVYLNDLLHRKNSAITFRLPIKQHPKMVSVAALENRLDILDGPDYRDVPVYAVSRRIPETTWYLIAKIDQVEISEALRERTWNTTAVLLMVFLASALGIGFLWRHRDNRLLRKQLAAERNDQAQGRRNRSLNECVNEVILLADQNWRILEANELALQTYGYSLDEMLRLNFSELHDPNYRAAFIERAFCKDAWKGGVLETRHRRKNGENFPVECSIRAVDINKATHCQIVVRDITERKLIEYQLRQSVERQRLYVEQSSLAIIEWDSAFRVERWNPAAERIFGYKAEEAIGQYATFMVSPDDRDEMKQLLMNLAVKQDSVASTNKNQTQDGRMIICRWNNTPLADTEGKFIGAVSICEEITEHKILEDELERLAAVVRNCNELISITTPEGKVIFLNEPGCKMLGIEQYNVSRHFIAEFVADDLRETFVKVILPALLRGETWKGELRYRNVKTNKVFDAQTTIFGICDPLSRKPLYLANISLDITERKRVEAALHEKDRKLQLFAENVSDFIWTINFSGKATYISPSVKRLLGYEPEEFSRFTFKDYLTPASAQFALNRLEQAVAMMRPGQILESDTFEAEYRRKDGTLLWTEVHCNGMYDEKGVLIGVQGITRDISKRKRAEELLNASERRHRLFAENANAILWEMDFSGRYTYLSPSIRKQLGYTPEEAMQFELGQTMTDFSAKSARQCLAEAVDAYQDGQPIAKGYFEGEYYHKDGMKVWMGVHYSAMCDEAGKAIGMQGVAIDISDKKRIEAELTFKNVLLRTQQEVSIDGILAADGDSKVILRNQRFNEMWQMPPDISLTEDDTAVLHTGLALVAEPEAFLERVLYLYDHRTEKSRDEVVMKDGRVFDRYSAPMFGPDDQYYGRVWFFRDITDRKQAEESLRKSEERYRIFFENMTDGYPKKDINPMIPHKT